MLDGRQFGLGRPASASLGDADPKTGKRRALYEPVHGSAPDIAGRGLANPIAMIGSFGMALRYSFGLNQAADRWRRRSPRCSPRASEPPTSESEGLRVVSTAEMGDAIVAELAAKPRRA